MIAYRIFLLFFCFFVNETSFAQETPQSLAEKLPDQCRRAPGGSRSFDRATAGRVSITADIHNGHVRIESPSMLIISDGHTIWNYQKREDRVTIDNVTAGSAFQDPLSLFRFADNYTASIAAWNGTAQCTLELTPLPKLQSLLKSAGEIQYIILELRIKQQKVEITSASAVSSKGTTRAEKLAIKMLSKIRAQDFVFSPKPSTKVIDLRE